MCVLEFVSPSKEKISKYIQVGWVFICVSSCLKTKTKTGDKVKVVCDQQVNIKHRRHFLSSAYSDRRCASWMASVTGLLPGTSALLPSSYHRPGDQVGPVLTALLSGRPGRRPGTVLSFNVCKLPCSLGAGGPRNLIRMDTEAGVGHSQSMPGGDRL